MVLDHFHSDAYPFKRTSCLVAAAMGSVLYAVEYVLYFFLGGQSR
jgi:hypothetical protein